MRKVLEALYAGLDLSRREARELMDGIIDGAYPEVQVAACLSAYRMRLPTAAELAGFSESLLGRAARVEFDGPTLDMVGTGGDGLDTFNITTLSALTVAACGERVVKHGNGSASSKHGSSDTLRAAGFGFRQNPSDLQSQLDAANITFLHAPLFHPALGSVAAMRKQLGVGTLFNLLGPLVNPAQPARNYIGVADARTQGLYAQAFAERGGAYNVIHSNDGYDEATLTGPVRCFTSSGRYALQASDFGLPPTTPMAIAVEADATAQFMRILRGEGTEAETHTVAVNAGLALQLCRPASVSLKDHVVTARDTLRSGRVAENFKKLCAA